MAILKIRDAGGNVQEILAIKGKDGINGKDGKDGTNYVLTDADKQTIAELVVANINLSGYALKSEIPNVSAFLTEEQVLALIQANMPANGDEVNY
jgi:hypothetical protein